MVKKRNIYYRKKKEKGKRASYVIEGIKTVYNKRKKVLIKTLPDPETLINELPENSSFFKQKKKPEMLEIIKGLDFRPESNKNNNPKVPTIKIIGNPKNDEKTELDEEIEEVLGRITS